MSRSFHANRKLIAREARNHWSRPGKRKLLDELWDDVELKRFTKRAERARRKAGGVEVPLVSAEAIPIRVDDESAVVHYPASAEDHREIMRRLPPGFLSGVKEVRLILGAALAADEESEEGSDYGPDPHTGRIGIEGPAGVWVSPLLGLYRSRHGEKVLDVIHGLAYVYAEDLPDRAMWELYMRATMLCTFVHEIGHFRDFWSRRSGGPLREPGEGQSEATAERFEAVAFARYVEPYLNSRYPEDCAALRAWLMEAAGVEIPLRRLMLGPWYLEDDGHLRYRAFGVRPYLHDLSIAVRGGVDARTRRRAFADGIHMAQLEQVAVPVYEQLMAENPTDIETLEEFVCALNDVGQHERVIERCRALLALAPASRAGLRNLALSLGALGRFEEALSALDDPHFDALEEESLRSRERAIALIGLSRLDEARIWIERLAWGGTAPADRARDAPTGSSYERQMARALTACIRLREGELEELLELPVPRRGKDESAPARLLRLVKFDAAHALGRPELAPRLEARWVRRLRVFGWHDWFDELERKCRDARSA